MVHFKYVTLEYSTDNGQTGTIKKILRLTSEIFLHMFLILMNGLNSTRTTDQGICAYHEEWYRIYQHKSWCVISDTITEHVTAQWWGILINGLDAGNVPRLPGMFLQGNEMIPVATFPTLLYLYIFGLSKDSVIGLPFGRSCAPSNSPGRRAIAVFRKPNNGTVQIQLPTMILK